MDLRASQVQSPPQGRHLGALAVLCLLALGLEGRAQAADVALVLTPGEPYLQAATQISDSLSKDSRRCATIKFAQGRSESGPSEGDTSKTEAQDPEKAAQQLAEEKPKVAVAFGTAATTLALQALPNTPVVFCMVPNILDRQFTLKTAGDKQRLAGVSTDIAPRDQIAWIKRLSPGAKTMGVLFSERSRNTAQSLIDEGRKQGVKVQGIAANRDEFPAALKALEDQGCDGVLMIADAEVYNSASVQRLLLWGLRSRKPVWAFSANLVKAGAFAAVYAEPQSIASQTAEMVKKLLAGESAAKLGPQYPQRVLTAANLRTDELIGIPLSKDALDALAVQYGKQ